ncbi:uncharacterized protein [Onthophagus taurus]|uniref:uncharacterized protein n=1 Tax=Onthophagus taurus TaxID=166361 RepID=UPI0039BE1A1B
MTPLQETSHGFVIDTKPDNIPSQITKNIFLGSQDCTEINVLQKFGINYVLSVGIEVEHHAGIIYKFTPCLDLPETDITEILKNDCFDFLDMVVLSGGRVLVHCNAGVSRSSAIVIGYLMLKDGVDYDEAYDVVKRVRVVARPNDGFIRQLKRLTWSRSK